MPSFLICSSSLMSGSKSCRVRFDGRQSWCFKAPGGLPIDKLLLLLLALVEEEGPTLLECLDGVCGLALE